MGKSIGEIYAELSLKTDKLHDGIKKSNREIAKLEQDIDKAVESINAKLAAIGTSLSLGVTAPLTLFGKVSADTFRNFEQSMRNTYSVMSASGAEMEALRQKAEEMGATTRFSASQAANALYSLGSAGQTAAQAMNSLDGVLQLAGATGSDLAFTSSTIASTLSQFNLSAEKSGHIADVFSLAISKSQANMTKLSYSMKYVGPVAAGLGVSLETSTAALMRLYNTGFGGEQAGTILRSGLQKLASGTDDVKNKLQELGLSYDEVNPKTNNLADIIQRLKDANIDVAKSSELFGEAAAAGMQALIEGGGDANRTMDGLLQASDGAAKKMQEIQNDSSANTKAELASAFEAVQITLTSNVIPAVDAFAKSITRVLQFVNELPVGVQTTGTAFAALAAAAGPLLFVAVGIKKIKAEMVQLNLVMSANPVLAWGAAIAAAGAVALGIIAQVKKAHEDYYRFSQDMIKSAQSFHEKALAEGNKGRSINELVDKYDSLKGRINDSKEAQEEYNEVVEQLTQLLPDLTVEIDETGNALIRNAENAREAAKRHLERENLLNKRALLDAKAAESRSKEILSKHTEEDEKSAEQLYKNAIDEQQKLFYTIQQIIVKKKEIAAAYQEGNKSLAKELQQKLDNEYKEFLGTGKTRDVEVAAQAFYDRATKKVEKYGEAYNKLVEKRSDAVEQLKQIAVLEEKIKNGENALSDLDNPHEKKKKSYQEELAHLEKSWEAEKKIIAERKRYAEKMGEHFSAPAEKIKYLQTELKKLFDIKPEDIDKTFTIDSKELQKYFALIEEYNRQLEKGKGGHKGHKEKEKDNSYQAQIEELDKFYQEKLAKAKEYGQSSLAVEKEYQEKRLALIEQFIKEEDKKKGAGKGITVETKEATKDSKGSGVTLGEELTKTKLMSDAFARYQVQQKEQGMRSGIYRTYKKKRIN